LVTLKNANEEQRRIISHWCIARQLLLIFEFGIEILLSAHEIDANLDEKIQVEI